LTAHATDIVKSAATYVSGSAGGLAIGVPPWLVFAALLGPWVVKEMNGAVAEVFDTWRPRSDGSQRRPPPAPAANAQPGEVRSIPTRSGDATGERDVA
jgi:hypothetical protein